jgi:hypothetical protein
MSIHTNLPGKKFPDSLVGRGKSGNVIGPNWLENTQFSNSLNLLPREIINDMFKQTHQAIHETLTFDRREQCPKQIRLAHLRPLMLN